MDIDMFEYIGKVIDVYDADTCTVVFDLGFSVYLKEKVRLYGIDTPEIRTRDKKEKKRGYEARDYVRSKILNKELKFIVYKEGKFGRYLVEVILESGRNLNKMLIKKGMAKEYYGGRR